MTFNGALIGSGGFAKMHLNAYKQNPDAQITWVCDTNLESARKYADTYGIPNVTADYREALNDDKVDFVDIMVPNFLHKPIAIDAMRAGKHVMVEKPMARNAAECLDMIAVSRETGLKLFPKYHQRFDPVHRKAKEMIENGEFKNPVMSLVTLFANHLPSMLNGNHWRGKRELTGGGCLFSSGSHLLDIIQFMFGDVKAVTAVNRQLVANNPDKDDDNATVVLEFKSGIMVTFVGNWTVDKVTKEVAKEIYSPNEKLRIYQHKDQSNVLEYAKADGVETVLKQPNWFEYSNFKAIDHFIDLLLEKTDPYYPLEDIVKSIRTLETAYQSSDEGRRIVFE